MANKNAIPPDGGFKDHPERINRKGQPRKLPSLDKLLPEVLGDETEDNSKIKQILNKLAERAITKGGDRAAEILLARAFGAPKQPISMDSEITIVVRHES